MRKTIHVEIDFYLYGQSGIFYASLKIKSAIKTMKNRQCLIRGSRFCRNGLFGESIAIVS